MAVTAQQQYLSDIAQAGDADQCCIALGGDLVIDADGTPLCSFEDFEYPRTQACNYVTEMAESAPTQGGQSAGGFLGQITAETAQTGLSILDGLVNIFRKPQPPTAAPAATPPADVQENQVTTKQIITAVAVILGLVVVVYLIRKK